MIKNKNLEYLKKHYGGVKLLTLELIFNKGLTRYLQAALNKLGESLVVDGVLGSATLIALSTHELEKVLVVMNDDLKENPSLATNAMGPKGIEDLVMSFLADWESTKFHYNKGEKSYTTPYGVYRYAQSNTEIIKYCDTLFAKYGVNRNNRLAVKKINALLTHEEKLKIRALAWGLYTVKYMDKNIKKVLLESNFRKSFLSYMSNSINGGLSRGNKSIQDAIGTDVDGKIGSNTIKLLLNTVIKKTDNIINTGILDYMADFYSILLKKAKFKRFRNGWFNRIKALR